MGSLLDFYRINNTFYRDQLTSTDPHYQFITGVNFMILKLMDAPKLGKGGGTDGRTLGLGMEGREKAREAMGAAMTVRRREPAKRPGRVSRPREMAPSSRSGSTTK
jgi:hypothetical protein